MGMAGFEPATTRFRVGNSATELHAQIQKKILRVGLEPTGCDRVALRVTRWFPP